MGAAVGVVMDVALGVLVDAARVAGFVGTSVDVGVLPAAATLEVGDAAVSLSALEPQEAAKSEPTAKRPASKGMARRLISSRH
jgi:hypothetical protein